MNMNFRAKMLIMASAACVIMLLALYVGSQFILMGDYERLEKQEVQENLGRTVNVLSNELRDLSSTTSDWAIWDDTYNFIQNGNEEYIQTNLEDPSGFASLRIDVVVFINSHGEIVFGKSYNYGNDTVSDIPQSLTQLLAANNSLWYHPNTESIITGYLPLEEPLLFASVPILTTQHDGPIEGAVIMGRYLNSEEVEHVSSTLNLPVSVSRFGSAEATPDFSAAKSSFSEGTSVFVQPLDGKTVGGYTSIDDVYGNPLFVLRVTMGREIYNQGIASVNYFLLAFLAFFAVFGVAGGIVLEKGIISRVDRLAKEVKTIGKSRNLSERLSWNKTDELSILANAIDSMMDERLAAIEELSAMVGHDLRNPLTGISNAAYYLRMKYGSDTNPRTKQMLDIIDRDIGYANKIVNDLLDYSRKIQLEVKETDPKSLMAEALTQVSIPANIQVVNLVENGPKLKVDIDKMQRVFINLIKNAVEAMPEGGKLTVKSKEGKDKVEFVVADTGAGIPKDALEKLFTPLFTTKAKGMGFGLSICKRMVEAHGGKISAESTAGEGTTFKIVLPIEQIIGKGENS